MTPETQNILIYGALGLAALLGLFVMVGLFVVAGIRLSRRQFGSGSSSSSSKKSCDGNCGCKCPPMPGPGCIPAVECSPPYSPPIAIRGLSCNPNDPLFTYAADVQGFVDAANRQKEMQRQVASMERMEETMRYMRGNAPAPAAKPAKASS